MSSADTLVLAAGSLTISSSVAPDRVLVATGGGLSGSAAHCRPPGVVLVQPTAPRPARRAASTNPLLIGRSPPWCAAAACGRRWPARRPRPAPLPPRRPPPPPPPTWRAP